MNGDNFSVRWEGFVQSKFTSDVIFETFSIGAIRVFIQDQMIIDNWANNMTEAVSKPMNMKMGSFYKMRVDYVSLIGDAQIELYWRTDSNFTKETIPVDWLYDTAQLDENVTPTDELELSGSQPMQICLAIILLFATYFG
eukprot:TRINITY_DN15236_c0_g1_i1.p1 TRINITY_DN15236_c0_g1~~TRINITY_DN15236_c0_g1_i1.p1  ORF type:complete len:148 (-),score=39.51 TRINITY_DN15236_c0_g1_i1:21-440(-)